MEEEQLDTKKLKKTIFFTILVISLFLTILIYFFTYKVQELKFEHLKQEQELKLHNSINNIMESYIKRYNSTLERFLTNKNIIKLFKDENRDELYGVLKPQWDIIKKENKNITVMHFHKSDGTSLLRLHQFDKYGDNIAKVRPMLQKIHKEHKVIIGYETGLYAIVFRIIYPIFDNEKYIGALEIGINPNGFIDSVDTFSNVNGALFIKDNHLKLYKIDIDIDIKKGGFTLQSNITKEQMDIIGQLPDNYNFSLHNVYENDGKKYILHTIPVKDFQNEIVANLLFFYDISILNQTKYFLLYSIIGSFIIFILIILYLIKRQLDKFESQLTESYLTLISKMIDSKQTYLDFFNNTNSADIVLEFDEEKTIFKIKALNNMVKKIENITLSTLNGKNILEILPGIEKAGLLKIIKDVANSGKSIQMPVVFYKDEIRSGYREYYVFKLSRNSVVISYSDFTKQKALEDELKDKEQIMIAQSRHAAMGEMISMIAHQWRQPIAVISMGANNIMVDIELDMVTNEELEDIAKDILGQTQYLTKTIDDFRDFFKPKKDKELFFVKDIFEEALKVIGKSLENNDIELIKDCKYDKEIYSYSRELLQVFINIIKNAKEVLIDNSTKDATISISCGKSEDNMVLIKIEDNAGGVPIEIMDKIFEPYFSTKDEKTGTGLGLYMSKTIIEKHLNGLLTIENSDKGACFKIKLPIT
ncbi:MAG: ATP-binding protein [Campylobacterota bacterium]|nr:ATP-binding protein [Campylobacterota bacterium]